MIAQNVETVRNRIREACARCGRNADDIVVVGVTKTFGAEAVRGALEAGLYDLGENYVQELNEKRRQVPDERIRWHFIGHLQSNKAKHIADFIHLIHSVDNVRVAQELQKRAERAGRTVGVLVEVHTTGEATKFGIPPERAVDLVKELARFDRIHVRGLMTMGPFSEDPADSRPSFRLIAELKKRIEQEGIDAVSMRELSMGMSHDFEVAIEEGATILRIGTAIFGGRQRED